LAGVLLAAPAANVPLAFGNFRSTVCRAGVSTLAAFRLTLAPTRPALCARRPRGV